MQIIQVWYYNHAGSLCVTSDFSIAINIVEDLVWVLEVRQQERGSEFWDKQRERGEDLLKNLSQTNPRKNIRKDANIHWTANRPRKAEKCQSPVFPILLAVANCSHSKRTGLYTSRKVWDNVLAVTSAACYSFSHAQMAKVEGRWIKRHNQVLIKHLQPKYLHALHVFS